MNKTLCSGRVAVIVAYQSWVDMDDQVDYALVDLDKTGDCWARKLIRNLVSWNIFDEVVLLVLEGSSYSSYERICSEEGAILQIVPRDLYRWPRSWYPWAWNLENFKGTTEMILSWVCWLQKSWNPQTYLLLSVTGGFFSKNQVLEVFSMHKRGHRAAFHNKFGHAGYVFDSEYIQTVFPVKFETMALLPIFDEFSHLEQTFDEQHLRNESFQSRIKFPMGLWSQRHLDLLRNYAAECPAESNNLEFNSQMIEYLNTNYSEHQKGWLNTLEIIFNDEPSDWLSLEQLVEISMQVEKFGRVTFIMDFTNVVSSNKILEMIDAVSKNLFLSVRLSIECPISLLTSVLKRVDYLELNVPQNLDYCNEDALVNQLFYENWTLVYEEFSRNQKPCFGLSVNIPQDPHQKIAMLEYFKNKVDFNPCLISEKIQGDGYPRTPNIKFENRLSEKIRSQMNSEIGILVLDHSGRGPNSEAIFENFIK